MGAVYKPVKPIEKELRRTYAQAMEQYEALLPDQKKEAAKPVLEQISFTDTTVEACQEAMRYSPRGMLTMQDELSGFFGANDRYSGSGKSGASNRGFWLQTWNGGEFFVNRIQRGVFVIENTGLSLFGGIQPDLIRKIAGESYDDGLVQRLLPIVLRPGTVGQDVERPAVEDDYAELVTALFKLTIDDIKLSNFFARGNHLEFDDNAQQVRQARERRHDELKQLGIINKKLAAHCGKLDGYFARLCLIWHCIENAATGKLPSLITGETARRVGKFMDVFLLPHAFAFYGGTLNLTDDHEIIGEVADYILAHKLERVTTRDIARGSRSMRKLARRDTEAIFEQLEALGWVTQMPGPRPTSPPQWVVNPRAHLLFAERAEKEAARRVRVRALMANLPRGAANDGLLSQMSLVRAGYKKTCILSFFLSSFWFGFTPHARKGLSGQKSLANGGRYSPALRAAVPGPANTTTQATGASD